MNDRRYILGADLIIRPVSGNVVREIKTSTDSTSWEVLLVVANDDAIDVLTVLRRAYQDGREDRSAEVTDPRDLRAWLDEQAGFAQCSGDDHSDMPGETALEQAHRRRCGSPAAPEEAGPGIFPQTHRGQGTASGCTARTHAYMA